MKLLRLLAFIPAIAVGFILFIILLLGCIVQFGWSGKWDNPIKLARELKKDLLREVR
ncbi:hypothetical protein LCGC14_3020240 [marine sediment metagenome]|uniref:Uncharacterized protein n=1 Tax=marine sediment metagenome TaxID=412755 RepID=A0A0F8ZLR2_9ZZZZ